MFRCQLCECVVPPRTPCQHLVLRRRSKTYQYRPGANTFFRINDKGKRKEQYRDDPGGEGEEVVMEMRVCPACAAHNGRH